MGLHHRPGIGQRTFSRLRTLFLGDQRPDDPPTALELHTGADESMETTRYLQQLTGVQHVRWTAQIAPADVQDVPEPHDTIDRLREISYGSDRLPNLRGIPGEEWEYAIYRREVPSTVRWRWICHGLYTMAPQTPGDAQRGSQRDDGVAAAIRADWLSWNTVSIPLSARPLYACHVRRADTEMWTGRHLGGEH